MKVWNNYEVYEDGTIISPRGRKIKPSYTPKGYLICRLKIDGKWTTISHHKVIMEVYEGQREKGQEIDHINNTRDDNRRMNLRYVTKSENNQKSYDSGNRDVSGTKNANCKMTEKKVREVCEKFSENPLLNVSKLARSLKMSRMSLSHIKNKIQWKHISKEYDF